MTEPTKALGACRNGIGHLGVYRLALALQRLHVIQRLAQGRCDLLARRRRWAQPFNQHQPGHSLRASSCEQAGNPRAHGMSDQGETLPTQLIRHGLDISYMIYQVGHHLRGAVSRMAMPGKIHRYHRARYMPGKGHIGRCIIKPAMQGQHRLPLSLPLQRGQGLAKHRKTSFYRLHTVASCANRLSRVSRNKASVASGFSSGYM